MSLEPSQVRAVRLRVVEDFLSQVVPAELQYIELLEELLLDSETRPISGSSPVAVFGGLAAVGGDPLSLVAPYAMLAVTATLKELRQTAPPPSREAVATAIRSAARAFGAPKTTQDVLAAEIAPRLVHWLNLDESTSSPSNSSTSRQNLGADTIDVAAFIEPPGEKRLVEWRESEDTDNSQRREFLEIEVEALFWKNANRYQLFVDECEGFHILVRPSEGSDARSVNWEKLKPRHSILLGLIMRKLRRGGVLRYAEIERALAGPDSTYNDDHVVQKIKHELNSILLNFLDAGWMRSPRGTHQYEIIGAISYCWIRPRDGRSLRLSPRSPT